MSLTDHLFRGNYCECSIRYILSWFFFLGAVAISISILLINSKNIDYGDVNFTVRTLFFMTITIISAIISRCMCYGYEDLESTKPLKSNNYNELKYTPDNV